MSNLAPNLSNFEAVVVERTKGVFPSIVAQLEVPPAMSSKVALAAGKADYHGDKVLTAFEVIGIEIEPLDSSRIQLVISLKRLQTYYISAVFIPTLCLIIAAEITLFINESHFEATIMVSLTRYATM